MPEEILEEQAPEEEVTIEEEATPEPEPVQEQKPDPEPTVLTESDVERVLAEAKLPDVSRARLVERQWQSEDALREAVEAEAAYVAELTGAGRPVGQERPAKADEPKDSETRLRERYAQIEKRYGLAR